MKQARPVCGLVALLASALLATLASNARSDAIGDAVAAYSTLPNKKALAVARAGDVVVSGTADSQPSDSAAAFTALERCEAARTQTEVASACEIVRSGTTEVATGASILALVPAGAHPLFLWRFQTGASTVYLAGSIHVMKPTLYPLPSQFEAAFGTAERLAVEVDTVNARPETLQQKTLEYAVLPGSNTIENVISKGSYAKLATFLAEQEVPLANIERLRPAMLATQLAVTRLIALGYLPNYGLESHFITRVGTRPILELESIDEQFEVLTSPGPDVQEEMLIDTLEQMHTIEPIVASMLSAWFAGDDTEFMRLFELQTGASAGYQKFMDRIIDERNRTMAERVSAYLAMGGTTFVLVGTAHLTGKAGIPAILASRGYPGHRIYSDEEINAR